LGVRPGAATEGVPAVVEGEPVCEPLLLVVDPVGFVAGFSPAARSLSRAASTSPSRALSRRSTDARYCSTVASSAAGGDSAFSGHDLAGLLEQVLDDGRGRLEIAFVDVDLVLELLLRILAVAADRVGPRDALGFRERFSAGALCAVPPRRARPRRRRSGDDERDTCEHGACLLSICIPC
jgi:hypothetical protein